MHPIFKIELHYRDLPLLERIQAFFDVGNITESKTRDSVAFAVTSVKEINEVIIPHFDKYKLLTQKQVDFELFKSVLELINKGEHLTGEGLRKVFAIRASINNCLIPDEFSSDITPVIRPESVNHVIADPYWLVGFIEGEGCFFVDIFKSKTHKVGYQLKLKFQITQHSRDKELINSLEKYLGCGIIRDVVKRPACDFVVNKLLDIEQKIIALLIQCPLQGTKSLDFEDFLKVAQMMKNKDHLTLDGIQKILKIKSGMNTGRK